MPIAASFPPNTFSPIESAPRAWASRSARLQQGAPVSASALSRDDLNVVYPPTSAPARSWTDPHQTYYLAGSLTDRPDLQLAHDR